MNVLERIVQSKSAEVKRSKERLPEGVLRGLLSEAPPVRDFAQALRSGSAPRVIAEIKRASPTAGVLNPEQATVDWSPEALAQAYERAGARCLSVLTDVPHFWGHPDHLLAARQVTGLPVLRKDFIVDPYQVDESRWLGADAVLLIVRVLSHEALAQCARRAWELGMATLVEIHADDELERALALGAGAILGINHRDLDTLELDMERAIRLRPRVPGERLLVAESGLGRPDELRRLVAAGIEAFLVGSHLVQREDPQAGLEALLRLP